MFTLTHFLTPREQRMADMVAAAEGVPTASFGGHPRAERVRVRFGEAESRSPVDDDFGIVCVGASLARSEPTPSHGDVLGALMQLGYERDRMGDILVGDGEIYAFFEEPTAALVLRDWTRAGKTTLRPVRRVTPSESRLPTPRVVERVVTLQSMRLDAFVGHAFGMSRTKALEPIRAGRVQLNFAACLDPSEVIEPGDMVSVRGEGRAMVMAAEGESRSGRIFVRIGRYM